jgi:hypothetical protein
MRHVLKASLVLLFTSCFCFAADAPWKGKPYDQWNDKDLQRIFSDSPWARLSTVTRTWGSDSGNTPSSASGADPRRTGGTGPNTRGGPQGGAQGGSSAPEADNLTISVHWASSRVIRAASARKAVLRGGKSDLDVAKYASQPQDEYQITVQSEDMSPFVRHDEKFYQENSYLEPKKSKTKIAPSQVRFERDANGAVTTAIFFFAKKTSSGDPIISADEKNVDFSCKIESSTLKVTFEPQKMVDTQGSDL